MRMKVDDSAAYDRLAGTHRSHYYQPDACCVCGREMKDALNAEWLLLCRDNHGDVWALEHPSDAADLKCMGQLAVPNLYVQPIGSECLRKKQHRVLRSCAVRTLNDIRNLQSD